MTKLRTTLTLLIALVVPMIAAGPFHVGHSQAVSDGLTEATGVTGQRNLAAPDIPAADSGRDCGRESPPCCMERDDQGRCTVWFDGQVYLGSGNHLPMAENEATLPSNEFFEYVLTSTCAGGGPPPGQKAYNCGRFRNTCGDPTSGPYWKGYYEVYRRTFRKGAPGGKAGDTWGPVTGWTNLGDHCLGRAEGTIHQYYSDDPGALGAPWVTYVASYPGGKLMVQPPNGKIVLGLPVNFYTREPGTITYSHPHLTGLTQLRVVPRFYTWDFDDLTEVLRTTSAGMPYPDGDILHTYFVKRTYRPKVSIEFQRYIQSPGHPWSTNELLHESQVGQPYDSRGVEIRTFLSFPGIS